MKMHLLIYLSVVVLLAQAQRPDLELATPCNQEVCRSPDCKCSSVSIPGGLEARDTPQFVMVTFDDGINVLNIETYRRTLYNRRNSGNNCLATATFYVSHEYTNYQLVHELYQEGHEISLHSITHQTPQPYWANANYDQMKGEFGDQRGQMAHFANIPIDDIKGMRIPFLQMTGNSSFEVMAEVGLTYDSTWGTINFVNPGLWPYTLDFASVQDCLVHPCPTAAIPGVWEVPMVSWRDLEGNACTMVDSCYLVPNFEDEEAWFEFIVGNFENHYMGNRAPFGFFIHEWYISSSPAVERAFIRFLDHINKIPDVFMVRPSDVIEWVKDPKPINEYIQEPCRTPTPSLCTPRACGPYPAEHSTVEYWLAVCTTCPAVYPWIGNPLGEAL